MSECRFACTRCGKCCFGWLPLTLEEAIEKADLFPLAMVLYFSRRGSPSFDIIARFGLLERLSGKVDCAVLAVPTAYIPPSMPCPALTEDNLCSINSQKPLRCRTMPFYVLRAEDDQQDMLRPRKEWLCDIGNSAPVVYKDGKILDRMDFDNEVAAMEKQSESLGAYVAKLLKNDPAMRALAVAAAAKTIPDHMVVSFSSFFRYDKRWGIKDFAVRQLPVMMDWMGKVDGGPDMVKYVGYYKAAVEELSWFAERAKSR